MTFKGYNFQIHSLLSGSRGSTRFIDSVDWFLTCLWPASLFDQFKPVDCFPSVSDLRCFIWILRKANRACSLHKIYVRPTLIINSLFRDHRLTCFKYDRLYQVTLYAVGTYSWRSSAFFLFKSVKFPKILRKSNYRPLAYDQNLPSYARARRRRISDQRKPQVF